MFMSMSKFYTPYGMRAYCDFVDDTPSRTHQSFKAECDINLIVPKSFDGTFSTQAVEDVRARWMDVSEHGSFHDAMTQVTEAQEVFMTLPSHVREKFANDPAQFLDYASNPDNESGMRSMGLLPEVDKQPEVAVEEGVKK